MVWIQPPTPINLAGYWDFYATPAGAKQPAIGPLHFYILQRPDLTLDALIIHGGRFSGSIDGTSVTLKGDFGDGTQRTISGTVSGDEITGGISGEGMFCMVHSTLPFGRLDLQGSCQGVQIDLHKDYAIGTKGEKENDTTPFAVWYWDNQLVVALWFNVAGDLRVWEYKEPNEAGLTLHWSPEGPDAGPGMDVPAESVTLDITGYDANGIEGSFVANFPDGSKIDNEYFKVNFVEGF
jgi:hypothetical protein